MTQQAAVSARHLCRAFGAVKAVNDLTFDVEPGEVVALVGPNGCGKSTALRLVTGQLPVDAGTVTVAGAPCGSLEARAALAFVPDNPTGFDELTVAEYLDLHEGLYPPSHSGRARRQALLRGFGLGERTGSSLATLSNGMRRQVSIIAAYAAATPVLVIDEAAAALDPEAVIVLREVVRAAAAQGQAVLMATQDLAFAALCADRFVLLSRGAYLDTGTLDQLRARYCTRPGADPAAIHLEEVFLSAVGQAGLIDEVRDALAGAGR